MDYFVKEGWTRGSTCASGFDFIHNRFVRSSPRVTVHFLAEVLSTLSFCCLDGNIKLFLLSQRENFVTVKFFDPEISMIFYIPELPESKYAFSE